jgi:signal transduction histidine kinase
MAASAIALETRPDVVAARPNRLALWAIAPAGCAVAAFSVLLALTNEAIGPELGEPLVIALLADWITLSYVLGGIVVWWCRPDSRFGPLMIIAGFVTFLSTLSWSSNDALFTFGQALDVVAPVVFLHVFLAFPSGRLRGRFERLLVLIAYGTAIGLELIRMLFGDFGPHNLLELVPNARATELLMQVQLVAVSGFCLCGVFVLAARRRRSGPPLRRTLALLVDAFALALVMIAALFLSAAFSGPWVAQVRWVTFVTLGLAPLALVLGLVGARLARSSVGDLLVEVREDPTPAVLQDALARALRDPSLRLVYWLPQFRSWAAIDGRPVELPSINSGRATTLIDRDGVHVAALLHDPALADEPELLDAVTAAAGIAIENGRLHVELNARLEELKGSRARIVDAGQEERKRLERNLHDGAQQRLIALSLELSLLEEQLDGDPDASSRLALARREIAASLEELREVARGIHPAVVSGHGLEVALEQLVARASVPIRLTVEVDERLPEALEVAAYYLVSESLANVGKYAQASSATVEVSLCARELVVQVADNGVGGADTERGSGLRGLADRVEALGGRLRVWSPVGGGTRVKAEIPCEP